MYNEFEEAQDLARLRQLAAEKLRVPTVGKPASQADSLAVLYEMALSPKTAEDAKTLLHELQVHQVELDLQREELRRSQAELETALRRQADLVERAPVGYMTIDAKTVLHEINYAGARLLGASSDDLLGRSLADLLAGHSVGALHALLERTRTGGVSESCELQLVPVPGKKLIVQAAANLDTTPGRFLLVLMAPAITQTHSLGK